MAVNENKARIADPPFPHTVTLYFKNSLSRGKLTTIYFTEWIYYKTSPYFHISTLIDYCSSKVSLEKSLFFPVGDG